MSRSFFYLCGCFGGLAGRWLVRARMKKSPLAWAFLQVEQR
ncbi:hypothetical protein [Comamonas sp. UBA7528]|jgi:hypothetical protein|nr:hypothetical protein [Comamonas sp. UBA7528]